MPNAHVDRQIDKLIAQYLDHLPKGASPLPVDPIVLAKLSGNVDVEEREMIPEAAVEVRGNRFHVYLQTNFADRVGTRLRRRFSVAHELVHTFFFELRDGTLRPMRGSPRGLSLESTCHEGASLLLMPPKLLTKRLTYLREFHAEDLIDIATEFDVSFEVAVRRLEAEPLLTSCGVSFALARNTLLEYATYPGNVGEFLRAPAKGTIHKYLRSSRISLKRWFALSGLIVEELADGSLIGRNEEGVVTARRLRVSSSRDVFEMRRHERITTDEDIRRAVQINRESDRASQRKFDLEPPL